MYQSIIRDPGGNGLIRIQPDVCGQYSAIVNGSILVVPPGTTAFVAINGTLSRPYGPGRYEIFTGVDPFFVRLRNILTHGDTGTTVSVFFVSTERAKFVKLGTGEFPFREHRFRLTMKALASCNLSILAYLKSTRQSDHRLRNIVLIDEAHALLDQGEGATQEEKALNSTMTQLMINVITEIRAYGVGVIFSDQSPSRVGGRMLDNVDNSYPSLELQLKWRIEDLRSRLEDISTGNYGITAHCFMGCRFSRDNLVAYTPPEYFSRESDIMDALAIAEESLAVMEAELREIEKSKTNTEEYPGQLTIWDIPYAETELLAPYTEELKTAA